MIIVRLSPETTLPALPGASRRFDDLKSEIGGFALAIINLQLAMLSGRESDGHTRYKTDPRLRECASDRGSGASCECPRARIVLHGTRG